MNSECIISVAIQMLR